MRFYEFLFPRFSELDYVMLLNAILTATFFFPVATLTFVEMVYDLAIEDPIRYSIFFLIILCSVAWQTKKVLDYRTIKKPEERRSVAIAYYFILFLFTMFVLGVTSSLSFSGLQPFGAQWWTQLFVTITFWLTIARLMVLSIGLRGRSKTLAAFMEKSLSDHQMNIAQFLVAQLLLTAIMAIVFFVLRAPYGPTVLMSLFFLGLVRSAVDNVTSATYRRNRS